MFRFDACSLIRYHTARPALGVRNLPNSSSFFGAAALPAKDFCSTCTPDSSSQNTATKNSAWYPAGSRSFLELSCRFYLAHSACVRSEPSAASYSYAEAQGTSSPSTVACAKLRRGCCKMITDSGSTEGSTHDLHSGRTRRFHGLLRSGWQLQRCYPASKHTLPHHRTCNGRVKFSSQVGKDPNVTPCDIN